MRACKKKQSFPSDISVDYIFNCDRKINRGCKSGYLIDTLYFLKNEGVITETCFKNSETPEGKCPKPESIKDCTKHKIKDFCLMKGDDNVKREILENGPVLSLMSNYREFMLYD